MKKDKNKRKKYQNTALIAVALTSILSRNLSSRGEFIFLIILFIAYISVIIYMFIKGNLAGALFFLVIFVPMVVAIWGGYIIENITIMLLGIGLIFLICLLIIVLGKLNFFG